MGKHIIPAIMSGGAGTRLWPVSTDRLPKQFHCLLGSDSLIQATLRRLYGQTSTLSFGAPIMLANAQHEALVDEHLARIECKASAIALEPVARNTAATGALAAALAAEQDKDALVLLLPADHLIADTQGFHDAITRAAPFAHERIVTFGTEPDRPATGYGYIKQGKALGADLFEIKEFKEKPNAELAQAYLDTGGYSWNTGIFLFSPEVLLREFAVAAEIRESTLAALREARREGVKIHLGEAAFKRIPRAPLDIAVMENTKLGAVLPCDFGWADIGSWDEVFRLSPRDNAGNARHGAVFALETKNNLLRSDGPRICVAGVEDLIVIATGDTVLVLPLSRAQDVKHLLEQARGAG